jgi:hypothetical protein
MVSLYPQDKSSSDSFLFVVTSPSSTITTNPGHDEIIKPMSVNFQQRPTSTHGPMIYRMTSVNPSRFLQKKIV